MMSKGAFRDHVNCDCPMHRTIGMIVCLQETNYNIRKKILLFICIRRKGQKHEIIYTITF